MNQSPRIFFTANDALAEVHRLFTETLATRLRELLETKHLYQRVDLGASGLISQARSLLIKSQLPLFEASLAERLRRTVVELSSPDEGTHPSEGAVLLCPRLTNVKLYCRNCNDREAFAPVWTGDPTYETFGQSLRRQLTKAQQQQISAGVLQFLIILYQCQVCQKAPEAFLLRLDRSTWNLSLEGRSPMEHVDTPSFVPNVERRLYRDALIAHQSGKTLAGLFYLRTFIERFARRQTALWGRNTGDEIMSAYSNTLPKELSSQMPSLRDWYDKLSEALHEAREDRDLFDTALEAINHHFDIRRVHRLPEKPAKEQ